MSEPVRPSTRIQRGLPVLTADQMHSVETLVVQIDHLAYPTADQVTTGVPTPAAGRTAAVVDQGSVFFLTEVDASRAVREISLPCTVCGAEPDRPCTESCTVLLVHTAPTLSPTYRLAAAPVEHTGTVMWLRAGLVDYRSLHPDQGERADDIWALLDSANGDPATAPTRLLPGDQQLGDGTVRLWHPGECRTNSGTVHVLDVHGVLIQIQKDSHGVTRLYVETDGSPVLIEVGSTKD